MGTQHPPPQQPPGELRQPGGLLTGSAGSPNDGGMMGSLLVLFWDIFSENSPGAAARRHALLQPALSSCSPAACQGGLVRNFLVKPCSHRNTQIYHGLFLVFLFLGFVFFFFFFQLG